MLESLIPYFIDLSFHLVPKLKQIVLQRTL